MSLRPISHRVLEGHIKVKFRSDAAFAQEVGVSAPYVSAVLNGHRNLSVATAVKWMKALDLDPEQIDGLFETHGSRRRARRPMPGSSGETGLASTDQRRPVDQASGAAAGAA